MTTYYRSSHPDVLAAWQAGQDAMRELDARIDKWERQFPDHKVLVVRNAEKYAVVGLSGRASPGEHWRFDNTRSKWVPRKRTAAEKRVHDEMAALRLDSPARMPGMPTFVIDEHRWLHPGVREMEGAVWFSWGCDEEALRTWGGFDPEMWEQVKASAWHLAVEADEAERVAA